MHQYKNLEVWKKSRIIVRQVYDLTNKFPDFERFGLSSQIQRAVISIAVNIAEGSGRRTSKGFAQYLEISYASSLELECLLILANDLNYIGQDVLEETSIFIQQIQKMLHALRNTILKQV
jgi:four helix bundle protein